MDIYDKIKEIQEISQEAKCYKYEPEKGMKLAFDKIIFLCEQILIDHQTQQALKRLENEPYKPKTDLTQILAGEPE